MLVGQVAWAGGGSFQGGEASGPWLGHAQLEGLAAVRAWLHGVGG